MYVIGVSKLLRRKKHEFVQKSVVFFYVHLFQHAALRPIALSSIAIQESIQQQNSSICSAREL